MLEIKDWTTRYKVVKLYFDENRDEVTRPQWHNLMECLNTGDEIVIVRFSNALRGLSELAVFFELCRMLSVRIISVGDGFDSLGELFEQQQADTLLTALAQMPKDIAAVRHQHIPAGDTVKPMRNSVKTQQFHQTVVNMYVSGASITNIMRFAGFSTKKSIYDILNKYDIPRRSDSDRTNAKRRQQTMMNRKQMMADRHQKVIEEYQSGWPVSEIANKSGYSAHQIYRILKDNGVDADHTSSRLKREFAAKMYREGMSINDTAREIGYTPRTVYCIVKELGIYRSGEPW